MEHNSFPLFMKSLWKPSLLFSFCSNINYESTFCKEKHAANADVSANLKGMCHEIFDLKFFSWLEPIWAPDKQAYSIFEFGLDFVEIFDHKVVSAVMINYKKNND